MIQTTNIMLNLVDCLRTLTENKLMFDLTFTKALVIVLYSHTHLFF